MYVHVLRHCVCNSFSVMVGNEKCKGLILSSPVRNKGSIVVKNYQEF